MYKVLRSILFLFPPEWVHYFSMNCLKALCSVSFIRKLLAASFKPQAKDNPIPTGIGTEMGSRFLSGLQFKNPIGLGAGFDKNAKYLRELETLGFGFVEIGTVTPQPQTGNPKPRLFRLPKDKALINRMGFNNDGVKVIAERLRQWSIVNGQLKDTHSSFTLPVRQAGIHHSRLIIGGNIGKNKNTANEEAWKDYETCFKELHPYVDYFVVNVSSPNTPGLRELQEKDSLRKILRHLQMINNGKAHAKPIFLKIAPDLSQDQIDDVIGVAMEIQLDGIVATNTTTGRGGLSPQYTVISQQAGGVSGLPLKDRSTEIVKYIHEKTNGQIPIIASGGIFTFADANEKFEAGASLVQVWTGFIYEGPGIVKKICKDIA